VVFPWSTWAMIAMFLSFSITGFIKDYFGKRVIWFRLLGEIEI